MSQAAASATHRLHPMRRKSITTGRAPSFAARVAWGAWEGNRLNRIGAHRPLWDAHRHVIIVQVLNMVAIENPEGGLKFGAVDEGAQTERVVR